MDFKEFQSPNQKESLPCLYPMPFHSSVFLFTLYRISKTYNLKQENKDGI